MWSQESLKVASGELLVTLTIAGCVIWSWLCRQRCMRSELSVKVLLLIW